jgi:hypothetical protein
MQSDELGFDNPEG